jgi:hypothetical protein
MDSFLAEHKDSSCLALRLHRSNGYDYEPLGAACIPLPQLLSSLHLGLNSATHSPCQQAQVTLLHGAIACDVWLCCVLHGSAVCSLIPLSNSCHH